jgi:hypothetical protein
LYFKLGERGIPEWARTHGTDNLEAFDDVLRGTWYGWSMTQEGNAKARTMFEKAIELDPSMRMHMPLWVGPILPMRSMDGWGPQRRSPKLIRTM